MLALNDPRWAELRHAYGSAGTLNRAPSSWSAESGFSNWSDITDTPALLMRLEAEPRASQEYEAEPWYSLWSQLCHQGTIYTSSYAAVPHIVRIGLSLQELLPYNYLLLPVSVEIARAAYGPSIPNDLAPAYFEAILGLRELALRQIAFDWDNTMSCCVAATLVVTKGQPVLGRYILELSPEEVDEFLENR